MIKLRSDFRNTLARSGIGMNEFADLAGISRATLFGLLNPALHEGRVGGMQGTTAWKIANAYAQHAGVTPDQAWSTLLEEVDVPQKRRGPKPRKDRDVSEE